MRPGLRSGDSADRCPDNSAYSDTRNGKLATLFTAAHPLDGEVPGPETSEDLGHWRILDSQPLPAQGATGRQYITCWQKTSLQV